MYFCQELLDTKLIEIAAYFNLSHGGSVSFITHQVRKNMADDRGLPQKLAVFLEIDLKHVIEKGLKSGLGQSLIRMHQVDAFYFR